VLDGHVKRTGPHLKHDSCSGIAAIIDEEIIFDEIASAE